MRFSHKVVSMPALAALSFLIVLGINEVTGRANARRIVLIHAGYLPALELSSGTENGLEGVQRSLHDAVAASDEDELRRADALAATLLANLRAGHANPAFRPGEIDSLEAAMIAYYANARATTVRMMAGETGDALQTALATMGSGYTRIRARLAASTQRQRTEMDASLEQARENHAWSVRAMTLALLLGLVATGLVSRAVIRSTVGALRGALTASSQLLGSEPASAAPGPQRSSDELAQLLASLQEVTGALALRHRQLNEAQRLAHVGSWEWDALTRRVTWSEELHRIFGKDGAPLTLAGYLEAVHPDDLERVKALAESVGAGPRPSEFRARIVRADGEVRTLAHHNEVVKDAAGKAVGFRGALQDVTEAERAAAALRASEERHRTLFEELRSSEGRLRAVLDAALDAVVAIDAGDRITYWNPQAETTFGWSREEALGQGLAELIIPARYREAHRRGMTRFLAEGKGAILDRRIEMEALRRDGTEFPAQLSITAVKQGDTHTFNAFLADITDRKRAEAELRLFADVFRNTQVGLTVWCLEDRGDLRSFRLVSTNPAAARFLGVRAEDVIGRLIGDVFPQMLASDLPRQYREVVVSGEGSDLGEVRESRGQNLDDAVFSVKVFPLPGDCVGVASENVTEHKHLETQLLQAQKMEAVGRLAGGVAHDFNNSLGVILGYTELLMRQASDPQKGKLEQVLKATHRASALTRQLLAFSRKQVVDPKVVDLNGLLSDLAEMLARLIGEHIQLAIVPGGLLGQVKADPSQLEQVVMNLCVNARDAMPSGGRLRIETANVDVDAEHVVRHEPMAPGRYVMLAVSDDGCGIGKELLAHIFEPFFTTKDQDKGTGLGLAMVYGIVNQAGGYIWVESEVGRGTAFKVYLPRIDAVVLTTTEDVMLPSMGSETILLVEDEGALRAITREILEEHGYRVLEATGPQEALEIVARHPETIHLLLTDVVMPGMNGRQLAESLVAGRPSLRVLFVSGYTDDVIAHSGVLESGTLLLEKPFTAQALLERVRQSITGVPA